MQRRANQWFFSRQAGLSEFLKVFSKNFDLILFAVVLGIFTVPKVYEVYQEPIDANLAIIKSKLEEVSKM